MIGNSNSRLTFAQYIAECRKNLQESRIFYPNNDPNLIIDLNTPFEFVPEEPVPAGKLRKYGALLIHGLYDSPFSMRDLGERLQASGVLCRSILLPGHGSIPDHLFQVTYEDWIEVVKYGVNSLRDEVENIILIGYSTGATLATYHALNNPKIAGVAMLSPLIRIKAPTARLLELSHITNWHYKHREWYAKNNEIDYVKYSSITFKSVHQVAKLTKLVNQLQVEKKLQCPLFMAISKQDQVVSSIEALNLFRHNQNEQSECLLYSATPEKMLDKRIEVKKSVYPDLHIVDFSHISLPFSPNNSHYGQHGDFADASLLSNKNVLYGAYSNKQLSFYAWLYDLKLIKSRRRELTYNPDFDYMADKIIHFLHNI